MTTARGKMAPLCDFSIFLPAPSPTRLGTPCIVLFCLDVPLTFEAGTRECQDLYQSWCLDVSLAFQVGTS